MKPIKGNLKIQKTLKARMWHCFADPQRGTRSANHFQIDVYWSVTITVSSFITENNQCVKTRTIKPSMCVVNPFSSHLHIFRWHPPMHTLWIVSVDLFFFPKHQSRARFLGFAPLSASYKHRKRPSIGYKQPKHENTRAHRFRDILPPFPFTRC